MILCSDLVATADVSVSSNKYMTIRIGNYLKMIFSKEFTKMNKNKSNTRLSPILKVPRQDNSHFLWIEIYTVKSEIRIKRASE